VRFDNLNFQRLIKTLQNGEKYYNTVPNNEEIFLSLPDSVKNASLSPIILTILQFMLYAWASYVQCNIFKKQGVLRFVLVTQL
jgi:hypothetical protein